MNQIMKARLQMPTFLSPEAQGLLRVLFKRNPGEYIIPQKSKFPKGASERFLEGNSISRK